MVQHRKALAALLRPRLKDPGFNDSAFLAEFDRILDAAGVPRDSGEAPPLPSAAASAAEPPWMREARRVIGASEIPGPSHNSWISKGWARLGAAWFNDDETPWCGFFVAHCMDAAKLPYPGKGQFARAKAWLDWGKPSRPVVGAVVVFGRDGGGHVGFLVGESATNFYVLGGNQSNAVNITPIAKTRALGFRWPASLPAGEIPLKRMSGGTVSRNEA